MTPRSAAGAIDVLSARIPWMAAGAAALACLAFAGFTGHAWEDYFITFRSSLNLARGHGLIYQPGERVHTFTSPLGTLLPALFARGGDEEVAQRALWGFRLVSAAALAGALWTAARVMLRTRVGSFGCAAACLAWALDAKTVDFSSNGMESALLVLFVTLTWRALVEGARILPCAIALAGLQWTRPDGAAWFAALALAWLAFDRGRTGPWRSRVARLARAVALGGLFYAPWLVFAWVYYGSPIPHTILAKVSHHAPGEWVGALASYPWRLLFGHTALHDLFMPAYFYFGGWPEVVTWVARLLTMGAALAWMLPALHPSGRIASAAFFLGGFYVEYLPRSPWYYPGWQALGFIVWGFLIDAAIHMSAAATVLQRSFASVARIAGGVVALGSAVVLLAVAVQMRAQQRLIEDGHRREIGLWLRAQARPGDRVYLEPLGYVGYFSGLKMLDYPGLASPEVVAARRAGHQPHAGIIAALQPEWLVLRPDQVQATQAQIPRLLTEDYGLARIFDVRRAVEAVERLPGRGYLEFDALYLVFRRAAPRTNGT